MWDRNSNQSVTVTRIEIGVEERSLNRKDQGTFYVHTGKAAGEKLVKQLGFLFQVQLARQRVQLQCKRGGPVLRMRGPASEEPDLIMSLCRLSVCPSVLYIKIT
ncbi:hypothetical protein EVAR_43852_1 [Eumeta japonica]|uniref:Uncharacterized protein n=1 Tax=Eumeta variegata TaxID=151549 RepID=A0A4C1WXA3_EUMVA|nr:hypothetical protein EVAR_43852_1 [Eumeta japonica]